MYAVIACGGKQYKVEKGDVLNVEKLDVEAGKTVTLKEVLLVHSGKDVEIGSPTVKNASVVCEVVGGMKADKVIAFKYRRRKGYHRMVGHRQQLSVLKVKEIKVD